MPKRKLDELYIQQLTAQILGEVQIDSEEQFLDQLGSALKIAKIPLEKLSIKLPCLILGQLESKIWLDIYSFIGYEHIFINEIYAISKSFDLFDNLTFWKQVTLKINPSAQFLKDDRMSVEELRRYCIHKYNSFKEHESLNPDIEIAQSNIIPVDSSISSPCHIVNIYELAASHPKTSFYNINLHWKLYYYLEEAPYCLSIDFKGKSIYKGDSDPSLVDLFISSKFIFTSLSDNAPTLSSEYIQVVSDRNIVLLGIEKLLESLPTSLEEKIQTYDQSKFKISIPNWEPLFSFPNFVWYFNMLQNIPFPQIDFILNLLVDNDNNQDIMLDPKTTDPNTLKMVTDYFETLE